MPSKPAEQPAFIGQQYAFAAHIRDPENHPAPTGVEDRRMAIYRDLFFNNVEGFLSNTFPVLRELMDDARWLAMARDFYARHHCHSPLFLEIPREFLHYLEHERDTRNDLPFMQELAHYEWVELALSVAEDPEPDDNIDPDGDPLAGIPVLSSLAWPLSYAFPVHQIRPDFQPMEPGDQPTYMLVFREANDEISFIALNPVSARLFDLLSNDVRLTGRAALETIAAELQHANPQVVIAGGRDILQQWHERGIVLGTRP